MQVLVPLGEEVCHFELLQFDQMSQCEPENDKIKAVLVRTYSSVHCPMGVFKYVFNPFGLM